MRVLPLATCEESEERIAGSPQGCKAAETRPDWLRRLLVLPWGMTMSIELLWEVMSVW